MVNFCPDKKLQWTIICQNSAHSMEYFSFIVSSQYIPGGVWAYNLSSNSNSAIKQGRKDTKKFWDITV